MTAINRITTKEQMMASGDEDSVLDESIAAYGNITKVFVDNAHLSDTAGQLQVKIDDGTIILDINNRYCSYLFTLTERSKKSDDDLAELGLSTTIQDLGNYLIGTEDEYGEGDERGFLIIDPDEGDAQAYWDSIRPTYNDTYQGQFIDNESIGSGRYYIPLADSDEIDAEDEPGERLNLIAGSPWQYNRVLLNVANYSTSNFQAIPRQSFLGSIISGNKFIPLKHEGERRATLRVVTKDGRKWFVTTNFILQSISKSMKENIAISETFDGTTGIFINAAPQSIGMQGGLINAKDYYWAQMWESNWEKYLKGSVTSNNDARVFITYDGWLIGGHLVSFATSDTAGSEFICQISLAMVVTDHKQLPNLSVVSGEDTTFDSGGEFQPERENGTRYAAPVGSLSQALGNDE